MVNPAEAGQAPGSATSPAAQSGSTGTVMLKAVDLTLSFGARTILTDINVNIQRGAVTALIGQGVWNSDVPAA